MRSPARLAALTLFALVPWLGLGCGSNPDLRPTFTLVSPQDGSTNASPQVLVTVSIGGLTLDPIVYPVGDTADPVPFHGHWELYVDGQPIDGPLNPGAPTPAAGYPPGANLLGDEFGSSAVILGLSTDQALNPHLIQAQLVNQNHAPILGTPPVGAFVTIPPGVPAVGIVSPPAGSSIASSSVQLGLQVANFVLSSAAVGGANVPGQGHYRVFLDGLGPAGDLGEDWSLTPTVTRLPISASLASNITLTVRLVNNDESLLVPPVLALTPLSLPAGAPGITLTTPARGATVGTSLTVGVSVADFTLQPFVGTTADTPGAGHWAVLVDGSELARSFSSSAAGIVVGHGPHRVQVELRGNLDDPLSPPVVDFARVTAP